jgi:ADP-ribose pyrophosphatase
MEIPAGKLDLGEDPLMCAQRELQEETGLHRLKMELHSAHSPGDFLFEPNSSIFIWRKGLSKGERQLDDEEFLDVFAASLDELLSWVEEGAITDVKTTISAYWLDRYRRGLVKPQSARIADLKKHHLNKLILNLAVLPPSTWHESL